ncbi:secretory pathway protein Sec39-domain-containing protein [Roridomyces roridus]|uniref:Secretory pathway protein Sec39-domain-containing protein n=1 Tax=Roridomyces roridus TaxID=1738132 RepID=A0AAD7FNS0_9AGAR|nr:secretory pathway protein Sec39-domain-containing protein [Roridomyces roridus]
MTTTAAWTNLANDQLTAAIVRDTLGPVKDDLWVVAACADRIVDDPEVQRVLLDLGLERTTAALRRAQTASEIDHDEGISNSDASRRDALLSHFNNLPTDARLCAMREDDPWADTAAPEPTVAAAPPVPLSVFLTDSLVRSACLLAASQWFGALGIIFQRHTADLWPYRFSILNAIPEHVHPLSYRECLPAIDPSTNLEKSWTAIPWRTETDLCEGADARAVLATYQIDPATSDFALQSHEQLLSAKELSEWYTKHIRRVLSSTGMIDVALAIVQHAAPQGVPGLDEMGEELSLLARLVYDAPQGEDDDDWTLDRWYTMSPISVVRAYVAHSTPETLAKDIRRLVMPYLFVLESRAERAGNPDPALRTRILYEYILNVPLETAAAVFEASKPILPMAQRIIQNDQDMARLALACLYGSNSLDDWPTMNRIFECLPAWDIAKDDDQEDAADTTIASLGAYVAPSTSRPHCTASDLLVFFQPLPLSSLSRALDVLDVHLESGEILSRWSVPAPLRWFLQSNSDVPEQRAWANRMARRAGGSDDKLNGLEDWEWLLEDMLKLSGKGDSGLRGAFGLLSQDEVLRIFLSGLLSTGSEHCIQSPKNKLSLSSETLEDICLSCSRELYDNASSGNYTFGDMKLAYEWSSTSRPPSDRLLREKEFIEATSRLSSFNVMSGRGMPISPLEIRLTKDRLSLVSQVLSSNTDAYKHTEVILDLVHKLGLRDNVVAQVKTLAMLADTALQAEDFQRAYETSERMVDTIQTLRSSYPDINTPEIQEASEVCWVACFQLGRQVEFRDLDKKLSLVGRALELCLPEKLHDVLVAWRRLENEDIEAREERLVYGKSAPKPASSATMSLRARLQDFHMPSPPLLNTPDATALASRTFRSVAANFPFRGRSQASHEDEGSRSGSRRPGEGPGEEISAQATRVLSKGIGWLIGADE